MIHYHSSSGRFINRAEQREADQSTVTERARFAVWEARDNPRETYEAHGYTYDLAESSPTYDDSPLTGPKVRKLDAGGDTWSWYVGDVRWDQAVDTVAQARQQAEAAVEAVREASISAGIPITLPPGSTLDGKDASGDTVRLHLGRDEPEPDYWQQIDGRNNHDVAEPKFTVKEGRVETDIKYLTTIITTALAARSRSHSALNDANRAIQLGKYSDVLVMAQQFSSQGAPAAVDIAAVYAAST